jgi:hypothetical protein
MKRVSMTVTPFALAAIGFMSACVTMTANSALHDGDKTPDAVDPGVSPDTHQSPHPTDTLPDIGTKMPDGTVYAGLSMDTGKPSYIAPAGGKMPDGTVYAGVSPDTNKRLFTTPADAPGVYTWSNAIAYCKALSAPAHHDWRMPTIGELALQFNNRADIGGFNETGSMKGATGYYWSSLQVGDGDAWSQRFNDGYHEDLNKDDNSSLRCVR